MYFDGFNVYDENGNRLKNYHKKNLKRFISPNNPDLNFNQELISKSINYTKSYVIGKLYKKKDDKIIFRDKVKKMVTLNHSDQCMTM